ncbi:hypothetical protein EI94DRAFT_1664258 [Lactarius quietus]|nr:hypothetical protein EI94DRAFT_1664258 [Lactarius quietus]
MNDQGQTPLDLLLESNNNTEDASDLVELLLMYATIVDAQDRNNETPLQLPSCEGVSEIAQTLRNDSGDVSVGDNMDPSATTSLLAAQKGDEEIPQPMTPNSSQMRRNRFRFPSFGFRSGHRR